jgi:hypothetical protein
VEQRLDVKQALLAVFEGQSQPMIGQRFDQGHIQQSVHGEAP